MSSCVSAMVYTVRGKEPEELSMPLQDIVIWLGPFPLDVTQPEQLLGAVPSDPASQDEIILRSNKVCSQKDDLILFVEQLYASIRTHVALCPMTIHLDYIGCDISKTLLDIFDPRTARFRRIDNTPTAIARATSLFCAFANAEPRTLRLQTLESLEGDPGLHRLRSHWRL